MCPLPVAVAGEGVQRTTKNVRIQVVTGIG